MGNFCKRRMDFQRDNILAEQLKNEGNAHFKQAKYNESIQCYTRAIARADEGSQITQICLSNRAFCHIKMENYGSSIEDANKAILINPQFPKAYYRKGTAYLMLGKFIEAKEAFIVANKITGKKDKDIIDKLNQIKKAIYEKEFFKSIAIHEEPIQNQEITLIDVPNSYEGPIIRDDVLLTPEWCVQLMSYLKDQKKLHKKYVMKLLIKARDIFKEQPSLVNYDFPEYQSIRDKEISVCGDTHGQYYDLLNIFQINGNPSMENPYLFNGDFVDRGSFSVEVILCLLAWKVCLPNAMHMTRGNHESRTLNKVYGFEGEVKSKYDEKVYDLFQEVFNWLPLGYLLNQKVLVVHGGLFSRDGVTLDDLRRINRNQDIPDSGLMADILWSDPIKLNGRHPSKRGISIQFGPDVAHKFLRENNLELLVRSHEMKDQGYEEEADGKVITIFSAPNYCDQMRNKGAFIRFLGRDMVPKYTQFSAVEHPKIGPMAYARSFGSFF